MCSIPPKHLQHCSLLARAGAHSKQPQHRCFGGDSAARAPGPAARGRPSSSGGKVGHSMPPKLQARLLPNPATRELLVKAARQRASQPRPLYVGFGQELAGRSSITSQDPAKSATALCLQAACRVRQGVYIADSAILLLAACHARCAQNQLQGPHHHVQSLLFLCVLFPAACAPPCMMLAG